MKAITNLRKFVELLIKNKQLTIIDTPVNVNLELAEIHRRVIAANGPALLFRHVHLDGKKYDFPLVSNLFGAANRLELAFGLRPEQIIQGMVSLAKEPLSLAAIWRQRRNIAAMASLRPSRSWLPPIKQKIQSSLDDLPLIKSWPDDGGYFITLPLVYSEHPSGGGHNLGMYRMQRFNAWQSGMHWQIHKGGGFHFSLSQKLQKSLPVAVYLGGPPALMLSAIAPLPENVGELMLAAIMLGAPLVKTRIKDFPYNVLAEAEFCLIGQVKPDQIRDEGPFGDHYGYYSLCHGYPIFDIQRIYHRRDAIYPATVVGKPKQEDFFIGDYLQKLLSPLFPLVMPGIRDLWSYGETGYHSLSAAVVFERYAREAMGSVFAILGQGQLTLTKFLIVIDSSIDLGDFRSVLRYVLLRCQFYRDLYVFDHLSMDTLDYSGPDVNRGSKAVLLGLGDQIRDLPSSIGQMPSWVNRAHIFIPGCLVIDTGCSFEQETMSASQMIASREFDSWPLVILADNAEQCCLSQSRFLWTVFTRFEPAADIYRAVPTLDQHGRKFVANILVDCRMKPKYPAELFCDRQTSQLVSNRWMEYFPKGQEMGDSDNGHLDQ